MEVYFKYMEFYKISAFTLQHFYHERRAHTTQVESTRQTYLLAMPRRQNMHVYKIYKECGCGVEQMLLVRRY